MAARGSEGASPPPATAEADAVDTTVAQRARGRRDDRWYIILDRRWWEIIIVGPDLQLQSNGMVVGLLALMSCRCPGVAVVVFECGRHIMREISDSHE